MEKTTDRYRTYFSTKGELKTCFSIKKPLTTDMLDAQPLRVSYEYPAWAFLRKPMVALMTAAIAVASIAMALGAK